MSGPAGYSNNRDMAERARARLDAAAASASAREAADRDLLGMLLEMVPEASWIAAGCRTAKQWLRHYTNLSGYEAMRFEQTAELCHHHPDLAEALLAGRVPMKRAWILAGAVTAERAPHLAPVLPDLLALSEATSDDESFKTAVAYWALKVDEIVEPRRVQKHSLTMHPSLFGGGEVHANLGPSAFANVCAAIDAYTQDPDAKDAPYRRTLSERRADALDDICHNALTGSGDDPWDDTTDEDDDVEFPELADDDADDPDGADDGRPSGAPDAAGDGVFDGFAPTDALDERLAANEAGGRIDELDGLRRWIRTLEKQRRRRVRRKTKMRSGATINAIVDVRTLFGDRDRPDGSIDFDGFVMRGDGWRLTRAVLERMKCDSGLLATLFAGENRALDANVRAEQFSKAQRRALAARDGCCVFPGCSRPARHCDSHHLEERHLGGPTKVSNGALLCRFHHRLLHEHRWRLEIRDDTWVAIDPHGTVWTGRPAPPGRAAA